MQFARDLRRCFQDYSTFEGRSSKDEYFSWLAFTATVALSALIADEYFYLTSLASEGGMKLGPLVAVAVLVLMLPSLAVVVRRLHDLGLSGWWALLSAIPILGTVFHFALLFPEGNFGENRFGADPLGRLPLRSRFSPDLPTTPNWRKPPIRGKTTVEAIEQLQNLARLCKEGVLTDAEFAALKSKILREWSRG